jgi:serine/threonine protein kinase
MVFHSFTELSICRNLIVALNDSFWQLVDFRFAKKLSNERTLTICGMADFLAPEIIKGQGHGFAADWYAYTILFLVICL